MSYQLYHTEGIVLAKKARGEADALFTLYTQDFGMVHIFAKGMMREKSKLRGALDLFSRVRVSFVAGKELYRLTDAEVIIPPRRLREELFRFQAAGCLASVISKIVFGEEKDPHVWQLIRTAFFLVNAAEFCEEHAPLLFYTFQVKMLHKLGYLSEDESPFVRAITESPVLLPLSLKNTHYTALDRLLARAYAAVV